MCDFGSELANGGVEAGPGSEPGNDGKLCGPGVQHEGKVLQPL